MVIIGLIIIIIYFLHSFFVDVSRVRLRRTLAKLSLWISCRRSLIKTKRPTVTTPTSSSYKQMRLKYNCSQKGTLRLSDLLTTVYCSFFTKRFDCKIGHNKPCYNPPYSSDLVFSNWLLMYLTDAEVRDLFTRQLSWLREGGHVFFRESCFHRSGAYHLFSHNSQVIAT